MAQCFVICLRHRHAYAYTPYTFYTHGLYLVVFTVAWLQLLVCIVVGIAARNIGRPKSLTLSFTLSRLRMSQLD